MNGIKQGRLEGGKNWLCIKLKFQIKACLFQYVIDKGSTAVLALKADGRKLVQWINHTITQVFFGKLMSCPETKGKSCEALIVAIIKKIMTFVESDNSQC